MFGVFEGHPGDAVIVVIIEAGDLSIEARRLKSGAGSLYFGKKLYRVVVDIIYLERNHDLAAARIGR